jgi:hypothetical protein
MGLNCGVFSGDKKSVGPGLPDLLLSTSLLKGARESMDKKNLSRRLVLERGAQIPLGGLVFLAAASQGAKAADNAVCVDLEHLDAGQRSIRESLNYVEEAADQSMSCQHCGFYTATEGGCGTCIIFNGVANGRGYCESWSAKS